MQFCQLIFHNSSLTNFEIYDILILEGNERGKIMTDNNVNTDEQSIKEKRESEIPESSFPFKLDYSIEEPKEAAPEYVECIQSYRDQFTKGKVYESTKSFGAVKSDDNLKYNGFSGDIAVKYFKPS